VSRAPTAQGGSDVFRSAEQNAQAKSRTSRRQLLNARLWSWGQQPSCSRTVVYSPDDAPATDQKEKKHRNKPQNLPAPPPSEKGELRSKSPILAEVGDWHERARRQRATAGVVR